MTRQRFCLIVRFRQIEASWAWCGSSGDAVDASGRGSRSSAGLYREHYKGHYSDALGGGAEMARAGAPPCARAVLLQIAGAAGYSGRGRRPAAAATPSARLFSGHFLQYTHFLRTYIEDVNVP